MDDQQPPYSRYSGDGACKFRGFTGRGEELAKILGDERVVDNDNEPFQVVSAKFVKIIYAYLS